MSGDSAKDSALIGQFGVGFYSAFIVAQSGSSPEGRGCLLDEAVLWESDGQTGSVYKPQKGERDEVTLHLRSATILTVKNLMMIYSLIGS